MLRCDKWIFTLPSSYDCVSRLVQVGWHLPMKTMVKPHSTVGTNTSLDPSCSSNPRTTCQEIRGILIITQRMACCMTSNCCKTRFFCKVLANAATPNLAPRFNWKFGNSRGIGQFYHGSMFILGSVHGQKMIKQLLNSCSINTSEMNRIHRLYHCFADFCPL